MFGALAKMFGACRRCVFSSFLPFGFVCKSSQAIYRNQRPLCSDKACATFLKSLERGEYFECVIEMRMCFS